MLRPFALFAVSCTLLGQVPAQDARRTSTSGTNTEFTMPVYRSLSEWEARRAELRSQILTAAGLVPMPEKKPLAPRIYGRIERDGYSIEKVLIETWPGFYLGGNLYRPAASRTGAKSPGVLMAHGHWSHGRLENSSEFSGQSLGIALARQGHVGFAYDMIGYNDTKQLPHAHNSPQEELWSFTALGLQLWNSIRALDFLAALPDVDPERLAMTGASGGGTQTFLLAAVDDRLRVAAPVNMVSAHFQGGCGCENTPGLRVGTFNVEIAAVTAPRPMLLVAATGDWTKNVPQKEFPAIREIYALYGKQHNVEVFQQEANHNFNEISRGAVYRFFRKHLMPQLTDAQLNESGITVEKEEDVRALNGDSLPPNSLNREGLFRSWREAAEQQTRAATPEEKRERLAAVLGVHWPVTVASEVKGERIALSGGAGERVEGVWLPRSGHCAALVADPAGTAARSSKVVERLLARQCSVLLLDVYDGPRNGKYHLTFHRSEDAERVRDLVTGLAFLNSRKPETLEVIGVGDAAVRAVFASAVTPLKVKLTADLTDFQGTDDDYLRAFFVPGIARAGGLNAARELTATASR